MLLFNAASYNPFFTVLGLLLGAVAIGLGYGGVKLASSRSPSSSGRVINFIVSFLLLGGALVLLGLAGLCVAWVSG